MPRLTDPWFDAEFYGHATERGYSRQGSSIEGAQGIFLWCPCGFSDPRYNGAEPGKPHGLVIPFANPRNAPELPGCHGPASARNPAGPRPRWTMAGTGLDDLTLTPSIAVGGGEFAECWHGFITSGEVT